MLTSISKRGTGFQQNALSWFLTIAVLFSVYFFLQSMAVPQAFVQEEDELEFLPLDVVDIEALRKMDTSAESKPREQAIEAEKSTSNSIPEKAAEKDLLRLFETSFPKRMVKPDLPTSSLEVKASDPEIEMNNNQSRLSTVVASSDVLSKESYRIPDFNKPNPGNVSDINVTIGETSDLTMTENGYVPSQKPLTSIADKKPVSPEMNVPIKKASELGDDYANLSPIYKELIEWMKKNPAKLTSVIRRFMGYRNGDLTSKTRVTLSDRFFEIFLVCHEKQYEIRICIVESQRATLLIDKGFRRQSNYFRIGNVSRDKSHRIFSFGTSQESPSDARTDEFYRIFLTWWEQVNSNEEK